MTCENYRNKYTEFNVSPLAKEVWDSEEYACWQSHGLECKSCEHWDLEQQVIQRGHGISDFPCIHMAYYSTMVCNDHHDFFECPDMTIVKDGGEYGIPVRDGGASYIKIDYCPWCGVKL